MAVRGRRARRALEGEQRLRLAQFRLAVRMAREDLVILARRLDDCPPWLAGSAADEWKLAAGRYAAARAGVARAATLSEALAVHTELREAWSHLARSDALAYDEPAPESSEPCFFNPCAPRRRLSALTAFTDQTDLSAWQRLMAAHARGSGYAVGALYAGRPDQLLV
jgi:hypothetical protein